MVLAPAPSWSENRQGGRSMQARLQKDPHVDAQILYFLHIVGLLIIATEK
jgi:hypothetical protein